MKRESGVEVLTTAVGPERYRISATATVGCPPTEVWALMWDWERLLEVGMPGMARDFEWLSGSPDEVPSTFQFEVAGALVKEEIYERREDASSGRYILRYRTLEPALGILEYDAVLELARADDGRTDYSAVREVRLAPEATPDMLAEMVESETRVLVEHFG